MPFTSFPYGLFFLAVLTAFWALRPWRAAQKALLLGASAWFYASFAPPFLLLLVAGCLIGYAGGEVLSRTAGRPRTLALWTANGAYLALLGFFKYYDFFRQSLDELAAALGLAAHLPLLHVVWPVGISFWTFQGMSYLVDLHRGTGHRAKSLLDFALFMSFFPQLVAGPICRARELLPQIEGPAPAGVPDASRAVALLLAGVFKKVVIATWLQTRLVDGAFATPENFSSPELLLALYAYSMQVYADFSGYTDVALGCALLLGFRLPENFDRPYAATSIGEFWRRWHITFSRWLRDYVYFPLGGSRGTRLRTYRNLMITFVLGGLWHGPRWGFVVWGALHGLALVLQKAWRDTRHARGLDPDAPSPAFFVALSWLATFHLCVFARLFFRAGDLEPAWRYLEAMAALRWLGEGIDPIVVLLCAIVMGMNLSGRRLHAWFVSLHERVPVLLRPAVWLAVSALLLALLPGGIAPYIYSRF